MCLQCVCVYEYIHVFVCMCEYGVSVYMRLCVCVCVYVYECVSVCMCVYKPPSPNKPISRFRIYLVANQVQIFLQVEQSIEACMSISPPLSVT